MVQFSCNLQCNSTLGRCKIGKYKFPSKFADIFLTYQTFITNLHLLRVELHCKLQEKLHLVTGPEVRVSFSCMCTGIKLLKPVEIKYFQQLNNTFL